MQEDWFAAHPEIRAVYAGAADLNGQARGKRLPVAHAGKLTREGLRFPYSALNLDLWGDDIEGSPLVLESGDRDGLLLPTGRGPVPMPWLETGTAFEPIAMYQAPGHPFDGDPRHALAAIEARFLERGMQPVVATELEFFLVDDSSGLPQVPASPRSGLRRERGEILGLQAMERFEGFFDALYRAADEMGIPADAAISEGGQGQFEVNLLHQPSALGAADDAWLFKMLVKGLARRHGMGATFLAKPYAECPGSGMHMHVSLIDADGRNLFDEARAQGPGLLQQAIGGALAALPASTLIFAPFATSYARLTPGAHAPTSLSWGHENRTVAVRVPDGPSAARRLEHRVPGGDVNPYLAIAAVLGGMLDGIENDTPPPPEVRGNAYAQDLPQIPTDWATAIDAFESAPIIRRIFAPTLVANLVMTKKQELARMASLDPPAQVRLCLDTV